MARSLVAFFRIENWRKVTEPCMMASGDLLRAVPRLLSSAVFRSDGANDFICITAVDSRIRLYILI